MTTISEICELARNDACFETEVYKIIAASKDYNSRGRCRHHWFRMVFRNGKWVYFAEQRLPTGTFRAAERRATVYGTLFTGELVCEHNFKSGVSSVYIVTGDSLIECDFVRTRTGQLRITLPNGIQIERANPRA